MHVTDTLTGLTLISAANMKQTHLKKKILQLQFKNNIFSEQLR